jgi:hypothetical protein
MVRKSVAMRSIWERTILSTTAVAIIVALRFTYTGYIDSMKYGALASAAEDESTNVTHSSQQLFRPHQE